MRIALVVPGGVSRDGTHLVIPSILWLVARLAVRHDVQIVVPRQEASAGVWRLCGATVHNLGGPRGGWQVRAIRKLGALHRERAFAAFLSIWAQGPGEVAVGAARICRRPAVVHVSGGEFVWLPDVPFGARRPWRRLLSKLVVRGADHVTAASQPMIDLVSRASGVQATRVPLGVDTGQWASESPRRRQPGRPARLVSVGSLTPVKGHATLLRALAELTRAGRDVHVDLVGEDTSGGAVPTLVDELGLGDRTTLHGFLPQREAHAVVRESDLMTVTSRHEAGPVAMLEAAAVGVPTVGTPVGHVAEWAPVGAAARVPHDDPVALANAVAALLDDEDARLEMARRAQQRALAEDADWTAARFEELLQRAAGIRHEERPR